MLFSFICPSNDRAVFDACTGASLAAQGNRDFELICVDTVAQRYASAAAALNAGAAQAQGDYLVFLHQDICFEDPNFVERLADWVRRCDFAVAGVAGADRGSSRWRTKSRTNIVQGADKHHSGRFIEGDGALPCQTLDECLFIIPRALFCTREFPEFFPTWHLYAVEYCLWALRENRGAVLALPLKLWHRSSGASFNLNYFDALSVLRRDYRRFTGMIYTTMGAWPTSALLFQAKKLYRINKLRRARRKKEGRP